MQQRLKPEERRAQIVAVAADVAEKEGLGSIVRGEVARRLKLTHKAICYHFKTHKDLTNAVAELALSAPQAYPVLCSQALQLGYPRK